MVIFVCVGCSADEFNKVIRQVFPDVVSIDLSQTPDEAAANKKVKNRGFSFVKFPSHVAASRAFRHPSVKWAEEDAGVDQDELAKIKIAFVINLPSNTDENYLKLLFGPFGTIKKWRCIAKALL